MTLSDNFRIEVRPGYVFSGSSVCVGLLSQPSGGL